MANFADEKFDYYTIEPDGDDFLVYGHGTYERGSVLAGRHKRSFLDGFSSLSEAKAAYPSAEESGCTRDPYAGDVGPCAPSWFDEADAGERWDSDY